MYSRSYSYFMWLMPLSFFAFQFVLRLWPGLMMQQIMGQFSIDASKFGMLAAFYYYGYASTQIPIAMLLDRFGARRVTAFFVCLSGSAMLAFTFTSHFAVALMSRFLIGVGSAIGFLGVSKVISEWFPKEDYAKMVGYSFTFGLLGAIYGGKPVGLLVAHHDWRLVAAALSAMALLIAGLCLFTLRDKSGESNRLRGLSLSSLMHVLRSPQLCLLAFANLLMVGALEGFADVWGVPYLSQVFALSKADAAGFVSLIFVGMLFGGPILARLSERLGHFTVISLCGLGMAGLLSALLMQSSYHPLYLTVIFFTIGLLCCYQVIVFAAGADLVSERHLGVTVAFLNSVNMFGGSFFHTLVGKAMVWNWQGQLRADGLKFYDTECYHHALSVIPVCALLGAVIVGILALKRAKTDDLLELSGESPE